MENSSKIRSLEEKVKDLYKNHHKKLLFHGWHHINFVRKKAIEFGSKINADMELVEASALVHDLNYLMGSGPSPDAGKDLRREILISVGYDSKFIEEVEKIVAEADIQVRNANISNNGKALSDADTLFKCLPITPVIFTNKFFDEGKSDIYKLADRIISEQIPLLEAGIYFYTDYAKEKYLEWAKTNLQLWVNLKDCLDDNHVKELLEDYYSVLNSK